MAVGAVSWAPGADQALVGEAETGGKWWSGRWCSPEEAVKTVDLFFFLSFLNLK